MIKHMKKSGIVSLILGIALLGNVYADGTFDNTPQIAICPPATIAPGGCVVQPIPDTVIINGKQMKNGADYLMQSSAEKGLMVPLKFTAEKLGYQVEWRAKSKSVVVKSKDNAIELKLGNDYVGTIKNGKMLVTPRLFEEKFGAIVVYDSHNQLWIDTKAYAPDEASTIGVIDSLVQGKDGVQIIVKGQKYGLRGYAEISLAVPVRVATDLKKGDFIYVTYGDAVTRSLPPQGQAQQVEVLKDENKFEGKVYSVDQIESGKTTRLRVIGTSDFIISIGEKTKITNAKGEMLSVENIKAGSVITVYSAPYAALSYPAQTSAYRIVLK